MAALRNRAFFFGARQFDQLIGIAADEHGVQDGLLHFDGRLGLVKLPELGLAAADPELMDGLHAQIRILFRFGSLQQVVLVAGNHEAVQYGAPHVGVVRAGVQMSERIWRFSFDPMMPR